MEPDGSSQCSEEPTTYTSPEAHDASPHPSLSRFFFKIPDPWRRDQQAVLICQQQTTNLPCTTSQKSEGFNYAAAEAWNHTRSILIWRSKFQILTFVSPLPLLLLVSRFRLHDVRTWSAFVTLLLFHLLHRAAAHFALALPGWPRGIALCLQCKQLSNSHHHITLCQSTAVTQKRELPAHINMSALCKFLVPK